MRRPVRAVKAQRLAWTRPSAKTLASESATCLEAYQLAGILAGMKVTIDLDPDLYRAIKIEAAKGDRSVRAIVDEALAEWLDAVERAEDLASATEALDEYRRDGGVAAEDFLKSLAAETTARYGADEP